MQVSEHALFPTRVLTIQHDGGDDLHSELLALFADPAFGNDFDMHPDSLNLLALAERHPCIDRVRQLFLAGLARWLEAEGVRDELLADVVLFSNLARRGEFTLVHNHNADVVAVYYVQTGAHDRPPVVLPHVEGAADYFAQEDGVLVLHDPRFNANLAAVRVSDHARVYPRPGLLVLFPGYLWHSVTPHQGEQQRLALSANFRLRWPAPDNARTFPVRAS